ncbi:MAG TPA: hypothetical protein PLX62_10440 [Bacteroidales bacterium]|jgi:hypothetical protein|nr:hypothetical protein [Bacteroidales bacterium]HQB53311.1 hypothetical protein [Bacteroidales bacterium]
MEEIKKRSRNPENFVESARADTVVIDNSIWVKKYKRGEPCKLKNINLPVSMIGRLQEIADERWDSNFSALMVRIIRDYLDREDQNDR